MKKIIVTLFFAGASLCSFAQAEFSAGLKGGPNFANLDTDAGPGENYESRTGFHVGAFALIRGEKVGFQPEILFSQQGSKFKFNTNDPALERNFSYVNIPLIIKLYTIGGINLQVGPQIGLLTSAKSEDYTLATGITELNVKDDLKKTDVSLALGVGWELPFGLTFDGRYNWGLTDNNDGYSSGASESSIKNQVWQFSIGFKILRGDN